MSRKLSLYNRILSAVLALVLLLGSVPVVAYSRDAAVAEDGSSVPTDSASVSVPIALEVFRDGEAVTSLGIYPHEKVEITAQPVEGGSYQWQILHPERENVWVNIYDETTATLPVSLALVEEVLVDNSTRIRCRVIDGEGNYLYTEPVTVSILEPVQTIGEQPAARYEYPVMPMADEVPEFVTITINYIRYDFQRDAEGKLVVDSNGDPILNEGVPAFNPYIATLQGGTDLHTSVHNPTLVGYDAKLNGVVCAAVVIDEDNIVTNIEYNVRYEPADVSYSVRYYFQNIYDDLYVEDASMKETLTGKTGSLPSNEILKKEKEGFTVLFYQPESIAADGSTVFEVYYERNYYLMEFDCNGGYGAETIYIRYGSYVSVPNPVRPGYIFAGWDLVRTENPGNTTPLADGNADALPAMMPAYNTAYQAIWSTADTTYTVVYWRENADDNGYSYWGSSSSNATSATEIDPLALAKLPENAATAVFPDEGQHFQLNEAMTAQNNPAKVVVNGDGSTAINVYYTRNVYYITFLANGLCGIEEHTHGTGCQGRLICGQAEHIHSSECVKTLICTIPEHTAHTDECVTCTTPEHTHSESCCTLTEHTAHNTVPGECCTINPHTHSESCCAVEEHSHTVECWDEDLIGKPVANPGGKVPEDPQNGEMHRYQTWFLAPYSYVIFIDGSWYEYTGSNGSAAYDARVVNPICGKIEHVHGDAFCSCTQEAHTHGTNCNTEKCGLALHTHGNGCYCPQTAHTHNDGCYKDAIHTHTDNCYSWSCGATVHTHTDTCYSECTKFEHTHNSNCRNSNRESIIYLVEAKYDADITDIWDAEPIKSRADQGYVWKSSLTDKYYSFLEKMPALTDKTDYKLEMTATKWNGDTYTWYYYVEVSPYEDTTDLTIRKDSNVTYKLYHTVSIKGNGISLTYDEDYFPITGYTQRDSKVPSFSNDKTAYLYYRIKTPTLSFYNYNGESASPADIRMYYNQPLKNQNVEKSVMESQYYPVGLEPGAYEFGGWYTTPECYDGTEMDWDNATMPDQDMEIYAKWVPVQREVYFHLLYSDIAEDEYWQPDPDVLIDYPIVVDHGALLGSAYNKIPDRGDDYIFIGWFYMDEDNKKKFAPDTMEITRDIYLFAEWSTAIDTTYEVKYILRDGIGAGQLPSGNAYDAGTEIAAPTVGHSSVGKTKTFASKAALELLPDFQNNFFPLSNSHSILMDMDEEKNTYSFEYVYDDEVYYKIRYLEAGTGKVLHNPVEDKTSNAIITPKFLPIQGYIPQSFYIRKTLAYDGDATSAIPENVITFYYVADTEHGIYSFEYYLENIDSDDPGNKGNYYQYESIVGTDDLDQTVTANERTYEGYTLVPDLNTRITYNPDGTVRATEVGDSKVGNPPSGELHYTGLTLQMYFKRNEYPYIIEYREYGAPSTDAPLKTITGSDSKAKFESEVSHTAEDTFVLDGMTYTHYKDDDVTKSMTIRVVEGDGENPNKLVFYYEVKKISVFYKVVCTEETDVQYGAVSLYSESAATASGLSGSNAMPKTGFTFKGWYTDEACTNPVSSDWRYAPGSGGAADTKDPNGTKLKPGSLDVSKESVTYYALFEPVKKDLTITKKARDGTTIPSTDSFLFRIKGTNAINQEVSLLVTIHGEGSVTIKDLYCGDYTVTEITDWSWAYETADNSQDVTLSESGDKVNGVAVTDTVVTFTNSDKKVPWLHGENFRENHFN